MNPSDPGGECYKQGPSMGPCTILGPINGTLMNTNYLGLPRTLVNNSPAVVVTATYDGHPIILCLIQTQRYPRKYSVLGRYAMGTVKLSNEQCRLFS